MVLPRATSRPSARSRRPATRKTCGGCGTKWSAAMDSVKPMDSRRGWSSAQVQQYNRERFLDLISAGWDLVIIDEAHRLGGSSEQVARYKLGEGLAQAAPYLLLLSATPHQGKTDAFRRLMALLDEQAFVGEESLRREQVGPYVIRTEKRTAITSDGQPLFKPRFTQLVKVHWEEKHCDQQALYDAVTEYVRDGLQPGPAGKEPGHRLPDDLDAAADNVEHAGHPQGPGTPARRARAARRSTAVVLRGPGRRLGGAGSARSRWSRC